MPTRAIIERLCSEQGMTLDVEAMARARDEALLRRANDIESIEIVLDIAREHRGKSALAVASGGTMRQVMTVLEALPCSRPTTSPRTCTALAPRH